MQPDHDCPPPWEPRLAAHAAGAAPFKFARADTEWAVRTAAGSILPYDDEQDAREHLALWHDDSRAEVVRREVSYGEWEVPADEH